MTPDEQQHKLSMIRTLSDKELRGWWRINTANGPAVLHGGVQILLTDILHGEFSKGELVWSKRKDGIGYKSFNTKFAMKPALSVKQVSGYFGGTIFGIGMLKHKAVFAICSGVWPAGVIDHIDGNKENNFFSNLRDVSHEENMRNQKLHDNNKSGHSGVYWNKHRGKWQAEIGSKKTYRYLGRYEAIEEAILARKTAEFEAGYHKNHGR